MKKIPSIAVIIVMAATLFNCKPDPKLLEEAKNEGRKEGLETGKKLGYDSAMALLVDSTLTMNTIRAMDDHPPYDGHVHAKTIAKTTKPQTGLMYLTLREDHKAQFYMDFYNAKQFTFSTTNTSEPETRTGHGHFEYDIIWINKYDSAGKVIDRVPLAINLVEVH